ncbi:uncharacterized protein [Oryza sativa Japonica Group]|uniref:uncharacterized protein n=1 Tax=Oryza sativa subsp. japonica TaxID=39947 RepID=UPI00339CEE64
MSQGNIPEYSGSGIENEGIDFDLEDMLRHVEPEVLTGTRRGLDNWEALEKAAKELLYDEAKGCDKDYSVLRSVLELLRLKARHGWSDTRFNDLMDLLRVMLPKPNLLPTNTYQAKKLICPLSLGVQKMHACENHCILYRKEFADLDSCPTCGTSRYKTGNGASDGEVVDKDDAPVDENKKIPRMVMWYLPVKDRLKRLYSNRDDAELMRWHQEGRKIDGQFKGKFGCLISIDKTSYKYLTSPSKGVYMRHCHSIFELTKNIKVVFGKPKKKPVKRKKHLEVGHAIDVMHLEKNVFDSTIGTLLDIPSKTKDRFKSRTDLVNLDIRLANGPTSLVTSWQGYDIGGYRFYTMFKDRKSAAQNNGVRVEAFDASGEKKSYYRIIQDIWELDYGLNILIPVLRCQWVRDTTGVFIDDYGLTVVGRSKLGHKDDPWVLAERVAQVFYVIDPFDDKMAIVVPGKQNIVGIDSIEDASDYNQYDDVPLFTDFPNRIKEVDTCLDEDLFSSAWKDGVSKIVKIY